jgi:hypothetical protein
MLIVTHSSRLYLERKGLRPTHRSPSTSFVPARVGVNQVAIEVSRSLPPIDHGPAGPIAVEPWPEREIS